MKKGQRALVLEGEHFFKVGSVVEFLKTDYYRGDELLYVFIDDRGD